MRSNPIFVSLYLGAGLALACSGEAQQESPSIGRRTAALQAGSKAELEQSSLEPAAEQASVACPPADVMPTFEQFRDCSYREPDTGFWIVDGDIPIRTEQELEDFYYDMLDDTGSASHPGELTVHRVGNADSVWPVVGRCDISYCVSTAFGANHAAVVGALQQASTQWAQVADVQFTHREAEDGRCDTGNDAVQFNVRPVAGQPFFARAFFPSDARADRELLVDGSSFAPGPFSLVGILRHELGHTLGFRHEHTRPESGRCFEDNSWRPLTPYDSASVMHYPQCGGTAGLGLEISPLDGQGAAALYGNTGQCQAGYGFLLQTGTPLHETDGTFEFGVAPNGDLFAFKKSNTGTASTEVHVLSAASTYQAFSLQTGTALHETASDFQLLVAANRDVVAIKKSRTGTASTEVHVLSAVSGYQAFSLHTGTPLHETDDTFEFALATNRDLFAIKKSQTGTRTTEVHVLTAASNYQQFALQTGTALHETDSSFEFNVGANRDLFAFKKSNTGTASTEVHVLSASSNYQGFSLQTGTVLHETGPDFALELTPAQDLFAIKKSNTGTHSTEVHVVDLPSPAP